MKTLLVSVDFSDATRAVIATAVDLASSPGSRLIIHHALVPPMVTTEYGIGVEMLQENLALAEKTARQQLQHIEDELTARGLNVSNVLTHGAPAADIVNKAGKLHADAIVLGSHGHTAFYDLLIGSTTQSVIKHATCPIVIVPRTKHRSSEK
ncbi:universal stress protein UspA [Verrucomicrobia bacterium IMCC26134]|jgi:nucleotide-binding universal stress UspA family protein|nr:universal stress protein UspA [Verrucomicrobia bacterium IMCC26134]